MKMTCDADCTRAGWVEYIAQSDGYDLHLSVNKDADLDGTSTAFCHDEQEMILINGWLFSWEAISQEEAQ